MNTSSGCYRACILQGQAEHARRLASLTHQPDMTEMLHRMAEDFDDIACDLANGAVDVRHPESIPAPAHRNHQMVVLDRSGWLAWFEVTRSEAELLRPLPPGSLSVEQVR
ncbi:MAG: hypothetical protein JO108_24055 [Acidobacteriaceae bacterium]|nr:hypothetical protein [Acidobacteriaceae bacterium]